MTVHSDVQKFRGRKIKSIFVNAGDYFKSCDFYFDSLSPMGMKIAKNSIKEGRHGHVQRDVQRPTFAGKNDVFSAGYA